MTFDGRRTHTFYFREKWITETRPEHVRVENMLRDVIAETDVKVGFEDAVVKKFMTRLPKIQTTYKMKQGSRLTAVVYKWFSKFCTVKQYYVTHFEYAFSSFVNRHGTENFEKRALRSTALKRLKKAPRNIQLDSPCDCPRFERHEALKGMVAYIRKETWRKSVRVARLKTWLETTCVQDANFLDAEKSLDWDKSQAVLDEIG
jgi:hypothetical protein